MYLHRLVAWHFLAPGDISGLDVHHRNGNTLDNRPENLQLLSPARHRSLRGRGPLPGLRQCVVCGRDFLPRRRASDRSKNTCCSHACAARKAIRARWAKRMKKAE